MITKKNSILLSFLFCCCSCFAQVPNAFPDSNKESDGYEELPAGIIKKEISYFNISGGNFSLEDSLAKVNLIEIPMSTYTNTSVTFSLGKISIKISAAPFDSSKHDLIYASPEQPYLALIDKKRFWGTDGGVPKEKISSVSYKNGSKSYQLPDSAIHNLYEPNFCNKYESENKVFCHCKVYQSMDKKRTYIFMLNSDGAGGYEVTWVLEDGKYVRRVVDYGF